MAHLLITVCDRCLRNGDERAEATEEIVIAFDNKKARRLDLCAEHAKPYAELRELAEVDGVLLREDKPPTLGSEPCPTCGRRFQGPQGLASHIRLAHEDAETVACPECGRKMRGRMGLSNHRRVAHDVKAGS